MNGILVDGVWSPAGVRAGTRMQLRGDRIEGLESIAAPGRRLYAVPGLVNAHTHLDLTAIPASTLPRDSFAAWVEALVTRKRTLEPETVRRGVRDGIQELLRCGTVAVGDIDASGTSLEVLRESPLAGVAFQEVLGRPGDDLWSELDARGEGAGRVRVGISPHAPYSTPESTYRRSFEWAAARGAAVATHLGETREEIDFLQDGTGPLRELFTSWRREAPEWSDPHGGCVARVLQLPRLPARLLAVHCNHLGSGEEELLERCAAVVYCPRSHAYFSHPLPHPAARLLARGVRVALGTDSRASNQDLDLWKELACWRAADPVVGDEAILACATRGGTAALGLPAAELRAGDPATFQVVRSRAGRLTSVAHLAAACVRGDMETVAVCIDGSWALGQDLL